MLDVEARREEMVRAQVASRGVRDPGVLRALREVPREAFLPPEMAEFAYVDAPLPIECGQTISQPFIVALMAAALRLSPEDRVLEIGTGSGYAAAVLSRVAGQVYSVERHADLAAVAERRLRALGYENVSVLHGDGTLGWPEHAPFDAIVVAAGGPSVPEALVDQLAIGGRLVIPVGEGRDLQELVRVTRRADGSLERESLGGVRFVPLIGVQGWRDADPGEASVTGPRPGRRAPSRPASVSQLLHEVAEPISRIEDHDLGPLLERIGDARIVCIGEATHGTSEFYRMRARITRELIGARGFELVAIEGDWPDVARVDRWVRDLPDGLRDDAFRRFPTWMWRNHETLEFVSWLREHNRTLARERAAVGIHGLDLYSLFTSVGAVLHYLDGVDPEAAALARRRYGCLTPWESNPQAYGYAAISGRYRVCEQEAVAMLRDVLARRLDYSERDGDRFLDVARNAALVADAERYYRAMYRGGEASWNLRDQHMFDTLVALLAFRGPQARAVVWAHNSHVGDARATEMGARGQLDIGQLCRERSAEDTYLIGFGTDRGTVAAAHDWDGPMQVMQVCGSHPHSYERLCRESDVPAFFLPLRRPRRPEVREELASPRLERAIGVVYRPETELQSHYFQASLPHQFDEFVWFDESHAVRPIGEGEARGFAGDHPFRLSGAA